MAGLAPNLQNGSSLLVYIGNVLQAYCTNISFSRSMSQAAVGGIGSYSYDTLEAVSYSASGSFTLTRYTGSAVDAVKGKGAYQLPARSNNGFNNPGTDGNSMLHPAHFNPISFLTGKTGDIKIYERQDQGSSSPGALIYVLRDFRMTSYALSFTPGSLTAENISFKCLRILDAADGGTTNV